MPPPSTGSGRAVTQPRQEQNAGFELACALVQPRLVDRHHGPVLARGIRWRPQPRFAKHSRRPAAAKSETLMTDFTSFSEPARGLSRPAAWQSCGKFRRGRARSGVDQAAAKPRPAGGPRRLAGATGRVLRRRGCERVEILVFAGNHGVTRQGVSAYPAEVTAQMVANFSAGGAAINQLARTAGAALRVIPLALDEPTADFTEQPAMSEERVPRRGRGRLPSGVTGLRSDLRRRDGHRQHHGGGRDRRGFVRRRRRALGRPRHRRRRRRA